MEELEWGLLFFHFFPFCYVLRETKFHGGIIVSSDQVGKDNFFYKTESYY